MTTQSGNQPSSGTGEIPGRETDALVWGGGNGVNSPLAVGGAYGGQPVGRDGLHLSLIALVRYKWSVLAVTTILSAIAVASIWMLVVPVYRARAIVRVSPVGTRIVFSTEDNGMVPLYKSYLNTQVSIIRGPTVLERVLDDPKVQATKWYKTVPHPLIGSPPTHIERLLKDLAVAPRVNTELIDVTMTAQNAADAKLIADTAVRVYEAYSSELITATGLVRLETLVQEKGELEREIDGLVATRSYMTVKIGAADPVERLSQASARLATLEAERDDLGRGLSLARWELDGLPSDGKDPADDDATSASASDVQEPSTEDSEQSKLADYARDDDWRRLTAAVADAQHNLEQGQQRFGPLHPQIAELDRMVAHAEKLLQDRATQLDEQELFFPDGTTEANAIARSSGFRQALKKQVDRSATDLSLLDQTIDKVRAKVTELGEITKDMSRYDEDLRHKRETHELLRSRVEQLALERKAPARITIAAFSVQPTNPSRDRRLLLTVMAVLGSFSLSFGLSYVRLVMDSTVRDRGDVDLPNTGQFLGHLPQLSEWQPNLSSCPPAILEVMRMVRTALLDRVDLTKSNALLVTSSSPHAGKTSVSILLASSLASLGKRTLLVEADLRRPSLADRLSLDARQGLATVLTGDAVEDRVICSPPAVRFDVLAAGELPDGFTPDILANGAMTSAVNRWKQRYDFVILDSPPASPVADARILGGLCDGTIMVIRASHCRRAELAEAYSSLATTGGNLLGTILIGGPRPAGYSRLYDEYYGGEADTWGPPLLEKTRGGNGAHDSGLS